MILVHRQPFTVSEFHVRQNPDIAATGLARGPVIRVTLRFERWLDSRHLDADAFVDPGADETILSLRWAREQGGRGRHARPRISMPDPRDPAYCLLEEGVSVTIAGHGLTLAMGRPVRTMEQPPMAGFEDILLGRDFLVAHRLLVVLDGQEETLSILHPEDEDNRRQRERVLDAISTHPVGG